MKQYVFFIITLSALSAQSKPFNSFNVIIYPEYYFEGIMAELEAEIKQENLPLGFKMSVPDNSDSIFFVSGDSFSDPDVKNLKILKEDNRSFINVNINDAKFRLFIFYDLGENIVLVF